MKKHLIVLEGTDGSGKSTQAEMTCAALEQAGVDFKRLRFPRYENESSMLVRMYLRGDFGSHPSDVNAYAASTFFAVDRYASFRTDWKEDYDAGRVIFSDRYTTSNAVHQSSKLEQAELESFSRWLFHYEYDLLGLPAPTCVIFLDMPVELSFHLQTGKFLLPQSFIKNNRNSITQIQGPVIGHHGNSYRSLRVVHQNFLRDSG